MRAEATAERTLALLTELGRATSGVRVYLTGGASAVLVGWRERTVDVDIRIGLGTWLEVHPRRGRNVARRWG